MKLRAALNTPLAAAAIAGVLYGVFVIIEAERNGVLINLIVAFSNSDDFQKFFY